MKFRKRALVIEAVEWNGNNVQEIVDFTDQKVAPFPSNPIQITTDWGVMECKVGDMVMKGLNKEIYSCDKAVFAESYQYVEAGKYRKVSTFISAVQFTYDNWIDAVQFVPSDVFVRMVIEKGIMALTIKTLEGNMVAKEGDWVIRGVKGEYYFNDNEIFTKIYEAVETDEFVWTSGKEILKARVD